MRKQALSKQENEWQKDEDGRIILEMTVRDDNDFLSPFSASSCPVISADVADFIENRAANLPPKEPFALHICSNCIDKDEEAIYSTAIRSYFAEQYKAEEKAFRQNRNLAFLFAAIGIVVLALLLIFSAPLDGSIWAEVIDIVAWVFLWEATDLYFLENRHAKQKKRLYRSLSQIKTVFLSK